VTRSCSRPRPPPSPRQLAPAGGYHAKGWWLPRRPGIREKVDANHRMLSTRLNALARHHVTFGQAAGPQPGSQDLTRQHARRPARYPC